MAEPVGQPSVIGVDPDPLWADRYEPEVVINAGVVEHVIDSLRYNPEVVTGQVSKFGGYRVDYVAKDPETGVLFSGHEIYHDDGELMYGTSELEIPPDNPNERPLIIPTDRSLSVRLKSMPSGRLEQVTSHALSLLAKYGGNPEDPIDKPNSKLPDVPPSKVDARLAVLRADLHNYDPSAEERQPEGGQVQPKPISSTEPRQPDVAETSDPEAPSVVDLMEFMARPSTPIYEPTASEVTKEGRPVWQQQFNPYEYPADPEVVEAVEEALATELDKPRDAEVWGPAPGVDPETRVLVRDLAAHISSCDPETLLRAARSRDDTEWEGKHFGYTAEPDRYANVEQMLLDPRTTPQQRDSVTQPIKMRLAERYYRQAVAERDGVSMNLSDVYFGDGLELLRRVVNRVNPLMPAPLEPPRQNFFREVVNRIASEFIHA